VGAFAPHIYRGMSSHARQPVGSPSSTGGQFAPQERTEPGTQLAPSEAGTPAVTEAEIAVTAEGDDDFAFLDLEGSRRQGYTGRLDLRRAAAMDLAKVAA